MEVFEKKDSKFYWYDFTVAGKRYRGSTKETNRTRAEKVAALKLTQVLEGKDPLPRKTPTLSEFSVRFLDGVKNSRLATKTKVYYQSGWRLLAKTSIVNMKMHRIAAEDINALGFEGSPSNANCALRTLRRMLHQALEEKLLQTVPKCKLLKENGRELSLTAAGEQELMTAADKCKWRQDSRQLFKDILILMRDTGMRNERELYRLRVENLDWDSKVIFVPDSKTPDGRRMIPMSDRVSSLLYRRCTNRRFGWVFPSQRSKCGHLTSIGKHFREARKEAGLPENLVLYCGRHDYGSRVLKQTGNLAAVMKTMGHSDVKTAMRYQHPELETVRTALNQENAVATLTS